MQRKKSANKKVRNASVTIYDGITFKSKLEVYCYKKLKEAGISFQYEAQTFELQPAFEFNNDSYELAKKGAAKTFAVKSRKIRPITYTPDFVGNWWIIETKGNVNDTFPLKWKIFKYTLLNNKSYTLFVPRNQKQIDLCIEIINKTNEGLLHHT